jgi:hypothetical protein
MPVIASLSGKPTALAVGIGNSVMFCAAAGGDQPSAAPTVIAKATGSRHCSPEFLKHLFTNSMPFPISAERRALPCLTVVGAGHPFFSTHGLVGFQP